MPEQQNAFQSDHIGRKATKLGLSADHELVVDILEEAKRFYRSLANYQIGIVDCEMKRLSAGDRAAELTRLWADTFTSFTNMGSLLTKYGPVDQIIEAEISADIARERNAKEAGAKGDAIDDEFRKEFGGDKPETGA